jgi:prevent-host-death family protein
MRTFDIHEAQTQLSRLVDEAAKGEPFLIARAGKPLVKVTRIDEDESRPLQRIGFMKGVYTLPDDFEETERELDREIEAMFSEDKSAGLALKR